MASIKEIINLVADIANEKELKLIEKAYKFAEKVHEGQKRLNGDPYFAHLFETAKILAKLEMDGETIATGLLHGLLEDSETTEVEIEKEFGSEILFLVRGVTNLGRLKYRGRERYVENLRKFFVVMANDLRVVIIKFAERLHNLRTLEFLPEEKRQRVAVETIEVYAPLANRLGIGKLKGELEDAAFFYAYPEEYLKMEEIMKEKKEPYQKYINEIQKEVEKELKKIT